VPNPRTDRSALENSIRAVYGTRNKTIVSRKQPKRNGVELVNIERSTQRNGYITNFGARVLGSRVKADYGFADEGALTEEFLKLKARLTTTAVGQALVVVLEKMDGMTGLKPGVYYIPEHHLKRWKELAERVEGCREGNKITTARVAMEFQTWEQSLDLPDPEAWLAQAETARTGATALALDIPPRCDQVMAALAALVDRVKNHNLGPNGKPTEGRWLAAVDCFAEVAKCWLEPAIAAAGPLYFAVPHASVLAKTPMDFSNTVLQVHKNIMAAN
jgi:hypothetical protein